MRPSSIRQLFGVLVFVALLAALGGTSARDVRRGDSAGSLSFSASPADIGLADHKGRVLNGKTVDDATLRTRYPGLVALLDTRRGTTQPNQFFCAGTLVAPTLVLTAAHCADATTVSAVRVLAGTTWLGETNRTKSQLVGATAIKVHSSWNKSDVTLGNDLAVIKLATAIKTGPASTPMSVVGPGEDAIWGNGAGVTAAPDRGPWLVGWGNTVSGAGTASYPVYPNDTNIQVLPDSSCSSKAYWGTEITTSLLMCAGGATTDDQVGTSSCNGDSGGPVVAMANGSWRVVGVVSYGPAPCDSSFPAVYGKLAAQRTWLQAQGVPVGSGSVAGPLPAPAVTGGGAVVPPGPPLTLGDTPPDGTTVSGLQAQLAFSWSARSDQRIDAFVLRHNGVELDHRAAASSVGMPLDVSSLPSGTYQWCVTSVDDVNAAPGGELCRSFTRVAAHRAGMTSARLRGVRGSFGGAVVSTEPVVRVSVQLRAGRTVLAHWSKNVRTARSGAITRFSFASKVRKLRRVPRTVTAQVTVSGGGVTSTFRNVLR